MMAKTKFPTLATILLFTGIVWTIEALGYLKMNLLWFPIVIVIVAIGMIANRYK